MKRIAVYPNLEKPNCAEALDRLVRWLLERGLEVRIPEEMASRAGVRATAMPRETWLQRADLLIALGGDGTLLSAARLAYPQRVPILGVNFGNLGFLADVSVESMLASVERVLEGEGRRERRMMLRATLHDARGREIKRVHALNDVVLAEEGVRAIEIEATLDGTSLGSYRGDGLIIATPTGSTAYSLSAGGPVVEPTLEVLIATPICPHTLSLRPLLFPSRQTIEIRYGPIGARVHLAVDGQDMLELRADWTIRVRRADRPIYFVLVENRSYYEVLRAKLHWGGA